MAQDACVQCDGPWTPSHVKVYRGRRYLVFGGPKPARGGWRDFQGSFNSIHGYHARLVEVLCPTDVGDRREYWAEVVDLVDRWTRTASLGESGIVLGPPEPF